MKLHHLQRCFAGSCLLTCLMCGDIRRAPAAPTAGAISGITRRLLDERPVDGVPGMKTQLWQIDYPPGASAPSHHHPVDGIGYVVEGSFESAFAGEPARRVNAGQSFVDPAQVEHVMFRNASSERPLKFLVAYTIPEGTPIFEPGGAHRLRLSSGAAPFAIGGPALYPETLVTNPYAKKFLVSSVREGAVFEIGLDGSARPLIQDERLSAILGIAVDVPAKRLLVTNSDLGSSTRRSAHGTRKEAAVAIYDLTSGKRLQYVDLTTLLPRREHLINGITLDARGNAYVTDSLSAAIYRVDTAGRPSLLLEDAEFRGPGINLNGIVYHPDGYLITVNKRTGALYRVPLNDPRRFRRVRAAREFVAGDGLLLVGRNQMVVTANKTDAAASESVFVLESSDGWQSAQLKESRELGSYPTSCAVLDGKLFVLSSQLDEWLTASPPGRDTLAKGGRRAELREIGALAPERGIGALAP